jgi:hypothetical protein
LQFVQRRGEQVVQVPLIRGNPLVPPVTGTVVFVLPAGSLGVCELAGVVKANRRPSCCSNGLRLKSNSTSIGMELTVTVSTFSQLRLTPAAVTDSRWTARSRRAGHS